MNQIKYQLNKMFFGPCQKLNKWHINLNMKKINFLMILIFLTTRIYNNLKILNMIRQVLQVQMIKIKLFHNK